VDQAGMVPVLEVRKAGAGVEVDLCHLSQYTGPTDLDYRLVWRPG
jgi:hypothetical protein